MSVAILKCPALEIDAWQQALQFSMPQLEVRIWPDHSSSEDVEYALVWGPIEDLLDRYKNIKIIFSLGAGVDHLLHDEQLPKEIPIVRLIDDALTMGMSEYILYHVLRYHRHMGQYEALQKQHRWQELPQSVPRQRCIGIMGLGVLGSDIARKLAILQFDVAGWSRTSKQIDGVNSHSGVGEFAPFLKRSEILVCLLPLTPQTKGILNHQCFTTLPQGSYIINAARGDHLIEQDLLTALDSGQLSGATLDVFSTEPLPQDHPFWSHPKIIVTPHIASIVNPTTAAVVIADKIQRHYQIDNIVNIDLGY